VTAHDRSKGSEPFSFPFHAVNWQNQDLTPFFFSQTALERITGTIREQRDFSLAEIPPIATTLIGNMVHTAIVAIKIGMGMGYSPDELSRLGFAALVHDLGMFRLPDEMLKDEGRWAEDKLPLLHRHSLTSAKLLKQAAPDQPWLSEVVMQEHERVNGTGYPEGYSRDPWQPPAARDSDRRPGPAAHLRRLDTQPPARGKRHRLRPTRKARRCHQGSGATPAHYLGRYHASVGRRDRPDGRARAGS
jgi:hypothetical protein